MSSEAKRAGAVYDDPSTRPAVSAIMERCGFSVALLRGPGSELVEQTRDVSPEVVVVDLASGGSRGLRVVVDLRTAVPSCAVIVLSPFEGLREPALEAGAYELAGTDDLRDLERCLRRLTAELSARESEGGCPQSGVFGMPAPDWDPEQEPVPVVGEVPTETASERPGDGEPQARAAFAVQADETVEDLVDRFLWDA